MKFVFNPVTEPAFNLALEDVLLSGAGEDVAVLWQNRPSVIIGRNQNTWKEINFPLVEKSGIPVVRRTTGGGAVYHDLGNINYSFILNSPSAVSASFEELSLPVTAALQALGIPAVNSGRNDITVDGKKVSGCARKVENGRTLFHGTLLYSVDLDFLQEVLTPDPDKLISKGLDSVRSRVLNLQELLHWDFERFQTAFSRALQQVCNAGSGELAQELKAQAEQIATERYRQWEWNYGKSTASEVCCSRRFPKAGKVEASFNLQGGRISRLKISGDFFGEKNVEELTAKLENIPLRREDILPQLDGVEIHKYISNLTLDEFLTLFE